MSKVLQVLRALSDTDRLKKIAHDIMVVLTYAILLIDFFAKNPPPINWFGR